MVNIDRIYKNKNIKKELNGTQHGQYKNVTLEIFPQSSVNYPIILEGCSNHFFIGGTCVVLKSKDVNISKSVASFNKTIKNSIVKLSFPNEGLELKISGKIAWTHEVMIKGRKTLALGIQFQNLSPKLRGMFFVLANNVNNPDTA